MGMSRAARESAHGHEGSARWTRKEEKKLIKKKESVKSGLWEAVKEVRNEWRLNRNIDGENSSNNMAQRFNNNADAVNLVQNVLKDVVKFEKSEFTHAVKLR